MTVTNKTAAFMEYIQEFEDYVLLGLELAKENGAWSITKQQLVPVNAMMPDIRQKLRLLKPLKELKTSAFLTYSAEVDKDGYILYFIDVTIKLVRF